MFKNLYLFMKERKITQIQMAKELGITNRAFNKKIRGFTDFTSKEMFTIQKKFFPDKSLEEIFDGAESAVSESGESGEKGEKSA